MFLRIINCVVLPSLLFSLIPVVVLELRSCGSIFMMIFSFIFSPFFLAHSFAKISCFVSFMQVIHLQWTASQI